MSGTKTEIILSDTIQSVVNIIPHVDLKGSEFGIKLIYIPKEDAE